MEERIILHCAPTLGGLKTANLFTCPARDIQAVLPELNQALNDKGLYFAILRQDGDKALVYVYRLSRLQRDLSRPEALQFLHRCGYTCRDAETCIAHLKKRLQQSDFPHEIGLFLGYPVEDVEGFLRHNGQNCKCCGYWKVYGDPHWAAKQFARYKKCQDVYHRLYQNKTKTIHQLTVPA